MAGNIELDSVSNESEIFFDLSILGPVFNVAMMKHGDHDQHRGHGANGGGLARRSANP